MSSIWSKHISTLLLIACITGFSSCTVTNRNIDQIKDVDGNTYHTVVIGEQVWMVENLQATHLNDGTPIQNVENYDKWSNLTLPSFSWYNNDTMYSSTYGALYNFYVVETEKLCPEGWHVPTDEDWTELEKYYEGASVAGGSLKTKGTEFWKTPNAVAVNADGFSALPGGYRSYTGTFNLQRIAGFWWSSTQKNWYSAGVKVLYRNLSYDQINMVRDIAEKTNGFSVRCIKNQGEAITLK